MTEVIFTCKLLCWVFLESRFANVVAETGSLEFGADGNVADCRALWWMRSNIKQTIICHEQTFMDLCTVTGSAAWAPSWSTGRCSRAPASIPACRLWACGRRCWRRAFSTTVSLAVSTMSGLGAHVLLCLRSSRAQPGLVLCCAVCPAVDQEQSFQDKYLFYRFLEDEREGAPLPSEEERKQSQEELQDTLLLLSQIGPDAHMRMILRKQYGSNAKVPKTRSMARMSELITFKNVYIFLFFCTVRLKERQRIWRSFMKSCSILRH